MKLRRALNSMGIAAMTVALGYYVVRDYRQAFRTPVQLKVDVPCEEWSSDYRKYQTPVGTICAERDARDLIKRMLIDGKLWEPEVVDAINRLVKPGTTAIDVGAHMGSHTLNMARRVGPQGMVVAFEPQAKMYQELLTNLALNDLNNVRAEFAALGDSPASITMLAAIDVNEGITKVGRGGNRVQLRTLDAYDFKNVSFIKIDVEGFEVKVLEGARKTIARERPAMVIEINDNNRTTVRKMLDDLGYDLQAPLQGGTYLVQPRAQREAATKGEEQPKE